jgi:hypothetical protein
MAIEPVQNDSVLSVGLDAGATNGKSKFVVMVHKDPSIHVVGDAAIVRFRWMAESELIPDRKKSATNLHILMNWQKQGADWKLLSRASTNSDWRSKPG